MHHACSTRVASDQSRLAAVRYLGGILELPTFWEHRIRNMNDLQSLSNDLFLLSIHLLEDLGVEETGSGAVRTTDLLALDPEGINMMVYTVLERFPLRLLPADGIRSPSSLEIADRLMQMLQT